MKNSISIEQPRSNVLQRMKWQYVSLAAGLALAAGPAAWFGGLASKPVTTAVQPSRYGYSQPLNQSGETAVFYLTADARQAAVATQIEEDAQWVRHDNGSPEPRRSVQVLDVSTEESAIRAHKLVDDAMAAANFTTTEAPRFVIVELP